jgi:hypothetical protein
VTERDVQERAAVPPRAADARPNAQAARVRARAGLTRVAQCAGELTTAAVGDLRKARATEQSLWSTPPASLGELRSYIHSAAWVPGDEVLLEVAGRAYGYLIAILVSLLLYAAAWILQRPGRFLLACVVGFIVWLTI